MQPQGGSPRAGDSVLVTSFRLPGAALGGAGGCAGRTAGP